jgi:hypothetical protein
MPPDLLPERDLSERVSNSSIGKFSAFFSPS